MRGVSRWWDRRYCRADYASLLSVCTNYARRFSMPDETVETRLPWLDFSLPRRPCLGISVLCSIILQTLNSCAIRTPDSTACPTTCFPLTSSPCEALPTYSSPFVIWPPGCVQALLPPAFVSYPAYI